jgi:hypothetical protein
MRCSRLHSANFAHCELRSAGYRELLGGAQSIEAQIPAGGDEEEAASPESRLRKLRRQLVETIAIDFFDAPGNRRSSSL